MALGKATFAECFILPRAALGNCFAECPDKKRSAKSQVLGKV